MRTSKKQLAKDFDNFNREVFGGSSANTRLQTMIFISSILNDGKVSPHPRNPHTLTHKFNNREQQVKPTKQLPVNVEAYKKLSEEYSKRALSEKDKLEVTAIADTLIDDFTRRFHGDFWTPEIWVKEAYKTISRNLGENWGNDYIIWDPACGSKNLTRNHKFGQNNLFLSTLHSEQLSISENYNPEGTAFQYDFLNDDNSKLPEPLTTALSSNQPIIFLMNPPYGQHTNADETSKQGIARTRVGDILRAEKNNFAAKELSTQFLKRIMLIAEEYSYTENLHIFSFNPSFQTSPSFSKFVGDFTEMFKFRSGFMFNAGEFSGTSSTWGVTFSHWELKPKTKQDEKEEKCFHYDVRESYINDDDSLSVRSFDSWNAKVVRRDETINQIHMKSDKNNYTPLASPLTNNGFSFREGQTPRHTQQLAGFLGFMQTQSPALQFSWKYLALYSMIWNNAGIQLDHSNIIPNLSSFSIRKAVYSESMRSNRTWIRDKDIFVKPSSKFMQDTTLTADLVTYSLFSHGSNQTSLRGYTYNNKKWNVENQFFWGSTQQLRELAEEYRNPQLEQDLQKFGKNERYIHNWMKQNKKTVSDTSHNLLETANSILQESFKYRSDYTLTHPKYNLNSWDAGWLQLYKMCFSRDAHPEALGDNTLQKLKQDFDKNLAKLGNIISEKYCDDTGF